MDKETILALSSFFILTITVIACLRAIFTHGPKPYESKLDRMMRTHNKRQEGVIVIVLILVTLFVTLHLIKL